MVGFEFPEDLKFNRGAIADPQAFAHDAGAASWLFLCGEDFAAMDGGMSYAQVPAAVPESENIVSDPPVALDLELARRHVAALDRLPRPTLVTCRTGVRSAAVAYLYAGLRAGASAEAVLARADADGAPFAGVDACRAFVTQGLKELSTEPDLGESFARAIAAKNATALLGLLSPEVDFRAMTPGRFWEASSAEEVVNDVIFGKWFEDTDRIDAVDAIECDTVAGRRRVGYRFRVTNADGAFLVEQQAYFDAERDHIDWLRIMCSGYLPVEPTRA